MKFEMYRAGILTFESKVNYDNPFLDCVISATFTSSSGIQVVREAYWDGENIYKISFAPIELGVWTYTLQANEETGLNNLSGEIEAIEYSGDLDIYKHGFLKVSEDKRYFIYSDGTPFFWLGDTHWEFSLKEKWDESNHPEMDSMFKGMVDRRVKQGYNIYQTNLRSDEMMGGEKNYWVADNIPNVEFYKNELDRRMNYIADNGIVNALGLAWFMSIENNVEKYKNLARYIIARYGALPMIYTLAGEVGGYDKTKQSFYIDKWREVALYINEMDGYHHLKTAHYTNERPFAEYYQDEEWLDFTLNQAGHGDFVVSVDDYKEFLNKHNDKPFVEGETMYEFCSTLEENGSRMVTDSMVRRVAYLSIQVGGCGYTYGAQGIWDTYYEKGDPNYMGVFNKYNVTWYEGIDGIAGEQMGYMRKFYEDQNFETLYPFVAGKETIGDPFGKKLPLITVSKDKKHWVLYYPESTRKSSKLKGLNNATYSLVWFNPINGKYSEKQEVVIENNEWDIPKKPDQNDWCLVLKEKES